MKRRSSGQWQPGSIARRASWRRFRWTSLIFPVFVGAVATFPLTWWLEQRGEHDPNLAPAFWGLILAVVLLLASFGWGAARRRWQSNNGSFVYVGAQPGGDVDIERVQHLFELPGINPFDVPLRARSSIVDLAAPAHQTLSKLVTDFEYLLRPNNTETPTNIVTNFPWPFALGIGWSLAAAGDSHLYFWHLANRSDEAQPAVGSSLKPTTWFRQDLTDVISADDMRCNSLAEPARDRGKGAYPADVGVLRLALQLSGPVGQGKRTDIHRCLTIGQTHGQVGQGRRPRWFNHPSVFAEHAKLAAKEINYALTAPEHASAEVWVEAALPKPVAVAIGYRLRAFHKLDNETMSRLRFGLYDPQRKTSNFLTLWKPTPTRTSPTDTAERLVNLTSRAVRVLSRDGDTILEVPPDGTEAGHLQEVRGETRPLLTEPKIDAIDVSYSEIQHLPDPQPGITYIVTRLTATTSTSVGRNDLVFVLDTVTNDQQSVIECHNFGRHYP